MLFKLGKIVATPSALDLLEEYEANPRLLLFRHVMGDWGDLGDEDKAANLEAIEHGNRILSSYTLGETKDSRIWVITEADRSVTTLLLPSEY